MNRGISRTAGLVVPASIVVIGSLAATTVTDAMRENIYDIPYRGGDAIYPLAVTLILNMMAGGNTVRLLSLGMVASSASEAANSYGLI